MASYGVSNTDVDWMARGKVLAVSNKGTRSASISGTTPTLSVVTSGIDLCDGNVVYPPQGNPSQENSSSSTFSSGDYFTAPNLEPTPEITPELANVKLAQPTSKLLPKSRLSSMIRDSDLIDTSTVSRESNTAANDSSLVIESPSSSSSILSSQSFMTSPGINAGMENIAPVAVPQSPATTSTNTGFKKSVTPNSKRSWFSNIGKKVLGNSPNPSGGQLTSPTTGSPKQSSMSFSNASSIQRRRSSSYSLGNSTAQSSSLSLNLNSKTSGITIPVNTSSAEGSFPGSPSSVSSVSSTHTNSGISSPNLGVSTGSVDTIGSPRSGGRLMSRIKRLSISKGSNGSANISVNAPLISSATEQPHTTSFGPAPIVSAPFSATTSTIGSRNVKSPLSTTLEGLSPSPSPPLSSPNSPSFLQSLKRRATVSNRTDQPYLSTDRIVLNRNLTRDPETTYPLAKLVKIKPLREVSFALNTFCQDPPQQVPPRNPRIGNLEVGPDGLLSKNSTVDSKISIKNSPQKEEILRELLKAKKENDNITPQIAQEIQDFNYHSMATSNITVCEYERIINNIDVTVAKPSVNGSSTTKVDSTSPKIIAPVEVKAKSPAVPNICEDKLMVSSNTSIVKPDIKKTNNETAKSVIKIPSVVSSLLVPTAKDVKSDDTISTINFSGEQEQCLLSDIYTRCCHLREILPISTTMKQIKGKKAPLNLYKLMNLRPTSVEILALCDFLSVVPCMTVVLDNAMLSVGSLRLILTALMRTTHLDKLSLKNVCLSSEGWQLLCLFVAANKSMQRLDISQHIGRKDSKGRTVEVPEDCLRAKMDWPLLVKAIQHRGGIEEIILNGCLIPSENFADLIHGACSISTKRLGLASNDLGREEFQIVCDWATDTKKNTLREGIDIADNYLNDKLDILLNVASNTKTLRYLSLNSTGITQGEDSIKIIEALSKLPYLKFLDLSSNSVLSPAHTRRLAQLLPEFPELRRLHIDTSDLSNNDLIILSEAFASCKSLLHISLMDNPRFEQSGLAALAAAVNISRSIYLVDLNSSAMSKMIKRRLDFSCMRNVESVILGSSTPTILFSSNTNARAKNHHEDDYDNLAEDDELIDFGSELCDAVDHILISRHDTEEIYEEFITKALADRASYIRIRIAKLLDDLSFKRSKGNLNTEGKELLIRLFVLDANLYEVLNKYAHHVDRMDKIQKQKVHAVMNKSQQLIDGKVDFTSYKVIRHDTNNDGNHGEGNENVDGNEDNINNERSDFNMLLAKNEHLLVTDKSYQFIQTLSSSSGPVSDKSETVSSFDNIPPKINSTHINSEIKTGITNSPTSVINDGDEEIITLSRNNSMTSLHSKRLAAEEGELHKLGTYMQQSGKAGKSSETRRLTGEELRQAIMKVKGRGTVVELIEKLSQQNANFGDMVSALRVSETSAEGGISVNNQLGALKSNPTSSISVSISGHESSDSTRSELIVDTESEKGVIDELLDDFEKARIR
ncbi:hypothetical protein NADFUDRAFT_52315 [Nadsonia fulvescens var. elongata DSM 6958]|uniref:RNI-like protein n=1 Tax=Nadsonia fulvescens var. elongata DSM 6958 TaxID=857566 RepID=A0A1E3PH41_9ASCO|nr:hypothetical protein NADFUDRAFT_52315 [Nadsonia fulvescens var. elongata DSM 6958]